MSKTTIEIETSTEAASPNERLVIFWRKWLKRKHIEYLYRRTWKANMILLTMKYQTTDELKVEYECDIMEANDILERLACRLSKDAKEI